MDKQELLLAFKARCERYKSMGFDRMDAPRLMLEQLGLSDGLALDIGTGKGVFAIELARRGFEVTSIDMYIREREMAEALAEEAGVAEHIKFVQADAAHLEFPDGNFVCCGMMDVLHHLENPQAVMSEMVRVTKSGGRIILADFDEEGFALLDRLHQEDGATHPRAGVSVAEAEEILNALGCRTVKKLNARLHDIAVFEKK